MVFCFIKKVTGHVCMKHHDFKTKLPPQQGDIGTVQPEMKIGIAMSGGVDSTACALMLKEKYPVKGFFMHLAQPDFEKQRERVESVAEKLSIELSVIDLRDQFEKAVLNYFTGSYFHGLTPNPCVICNREIKFGLFLDAILGAGMDRMATGHYAQVLEDEKGFHLKTGIDPKKDQSYFLSRLDQKQLGSIVFPLGSKEKEDIFDFVEENGFTHFRGQESQDVCFLEKNQIGSFLDRRKPDGSTGGKIVSTDGKVMGDHTGLFHYTIGQRKGLGVSLGVPAYVTGMDMQRNLLHVDTDPDVLLAAGLEATGVTWHDGPAPASTLRVEAQIRYRSPAATATVEPRGDDGAIVRFDEPQRAVTPGQAVVLYDDDRVVGGGWIDRALPAPERGRR